MEEHREQIAYVNGMGIPPISKITENLYLGSIGSTDPKVLDKHRITHIINAAREISYKTDRSVISLSMDDVPEENLFRVLEPTRIIINRILGSNPNHVVLVHCMAGVSRSASVVIYYLMKSKGISYEKAYRYVESKRPIVNPNSGFVKTLRSVQ